MSTKKLKVISLSVESEMHASLQAASAKLGYNNVSLLVRTLIEKYLDQLLKEDDVTNGTQETPQT